MSELRIEYFIDYFIILVHKTLHYRECQNMYRGRTVRGHYNFMANGKTVKGIRLVGYDGY